jgi:DNA polymerase-4
VFDHSPALAHLDMDAFYAAVEQRDFPELRGKPVVVGGPDPKARGVVSTCSYEARPFGIHSAMPLRRAHQLCPDAVFVAGRMEVYQRESRRIMAILREYSPRVQPLSLDEAFFDLTGTRRLFGSPEETLRRIKERVREETDLTCSAGLAPVKFVAKIASDLEKPDGLVIVPPGGVLEFLHPLPVGRLWGVGPKTLERLTELGVATIGDLAALGLEELERRFGLWGRRLHQLSLGCDGRGVTPHREEKSVGHETTFATDQESEEVIARALLELAEKVAARLRRHAVAGRTLTLKLRLAPFSTFTRSVSGDEYLDQGPLIYETARALIDRVDRRGRKVRLIGVSVSGLVAREAAPPGLFDSERPEREQRLGKAVDALGERFGDGAVRRGRLIGRKST